MLYRVKVGRDEYLGTPEEVVAWMSKAEGAPPQGSGTSTGMRAFMRGIAARARTAGRGAEIESAIDVDEPEAFLLSLGAAGLLDIEERPEASGERVRPSDALGDGPIAYGKDVEPGDIDLDELEDIDDPDDAE